MIVLIDINRNMSVGIFPSTKEALQYAKAEGILQVTFEKGGS